MGKRNRIKELEQVQGDLAHVIPALVNTGGQKHAAESLGVAQATISRWLKDQGYTQVIRYVKRKVQTQ